MPASPALAGIGVLNAARPVELSWATCDGCRMYAAAVRQLAGVPTWVAVFGEHLMVGKFEECHVVSPHGKSGFLDAPLTAGSKGCMVPGGSVMVIRL